MPEDTQPPSEPPSPDKKPHTRPKKGLTESMATPVPFWGEDPNILLDPRFATEFFPVESMDYNQKLNAVTRVVLVMTAVSFLITQNARLLAVSVITLVSVFVLHKFKSDADARKRGRRAEGFGARKDSTVKFQEPTTTNPFSNVLPGDYAAAADKLPAAPLDDPKIADQVLSKTQTMINKANVGQPDISAKLFRDLGEQLTLEQSMRPFYSMPSTTIPNDQKAFLDFCYGDMASCKTGNAFACARATVNPAMI
jgi:Family of unknown function (DUF5762)